MYNKRQKKEYTNTLFGLLCLYFAPFNVSYSRKKQKGGIFLHKIRNKGTGKLKNFIKACVPALILLILWQLAFLSGKWSAYVLPGPEKVWKSFVTMTGNGTLLKHVLVSFKRVLTGFSISFVCAFCLGMIAALKKDLEVYYGPYVEFMRNVPPISLIALLILWFGIGETSKIIIIVLASFFPMFMNIRKGLLSCDKKLLEVGKTCGLSKTACFFKIRLPWAFPDILVGMRIGLGYSWRAIIGAEMIAAGKGLGYLILDAQQMSRSDKVIVGIFVIGLVGLLCDKAFLWIIRKWVRGGVENS